MEDLRRFFRQIVSTLAAADPARLKSPLLLKEIRQSILPYRAHRRALQLESSEDYELVLIRLCAGQGDLARVEPDEVRAEFSAEALNSNPDLTIVHRHENASLVLNQDQVARAIGESPEQAFAPPEHRLAAPHPKEPPPQPDRSAQADRPSAAICRNCGGELPPVLQVKFCPHCGEGQEPSQCPECQTRLEPGWRHCIACGTAVAR